MPLTPRRDREGDDDRTTEMSGISRSSDDDAGSERAGGEPQRELSSRGPADDESVQHDSGPVGQDTPASGEEGAREAAREDSSRSRVSVRERDGEGGVDDEY